MTLKKGHPDINQHDSSDSRKCSKMAVGTQLWIERFWWDIRRALSKWQPPGKALLGCFLERTPFTTTSSSSYVCCEGKDTNIRHCPLPRLEGHLDSVLRMNFQRISPGVVQGGEALRGAARLSALGCPTAAEPAGELLGLNGQGSPLERCWFPVNAECHLLSHHLLPVAPGVFWQDTQAGAAQKVLVLAVP